MNFYNPNKKRFLEVMPGIVKGEAGLTFSIGDRKITLTLSKVAELNSMLTAVLEEHYDFFGESSISFSEVENERGKQLSIEVPGGKFLCGTQGIDTLVGLLTEYKEKL